MPKPEEAKSSETGMPPYRFQDDPSLTGGVTSVAAPHRPDAPAPQADALREALRTAYIQGCEDTHNAIQADELAQMPVENAEFGEAADDYAAQAALRPEEAGGKMSEFYDDVDDDEDHEIGGFTEEDCGRWHNGRLSDQCTLAGSEDCDWECPIGYRGDR